MIVSSHPRTFAVLLLIFCLLVGSAARADDTFRITAPDGSCQAWSVTRLKDSLASEVKAIDYTSHGEKHTSNGVPLLAVLKAAGVPVAFKMDPKADPHVKNYNLRLVVVIEGGDGYITTFSVAELLPEIGGREAWLVFDEDGKPLPERDGALKVIVPADQKPARWVRDVTCITVVNPAAATTQPTTRTIIKPQE